MKTNWFSSLGNLFEIFHEFENATKNATIVNTGLVSSGLVSSGLVPSK